MAPEWLRVILVVLGSPGWPAFALLLARDPRADRRVRVKIAFGIVPAFIVIAIARQGPIAPLFGAIGVLFWSAIAVTRARPLDFLSLRDDLGDAHADRALSKQRRGFLIAIPLLVGYIVAVGHGLY